MIGKLYKHNNEWCIRYFDYIDRSLSLHPDDVQQIIKDSLIFDNIEARIAAYPEVEFEIVNSDNGAMSFTEAYQSKQYAKLIKNEASD